MNSNFKKLLEQIDNNQYVGIGNPDAKLLFIGKEAGIDSEIENYHGSKKSWLEDEKKYLKRFIPSEKEHKNIRNLNHTWQKYQELYKRILEKVNIKSEDLKKYEISFVENVFTTELSNLHAKTSIKAKSFNDFAENLKNRKTSYFKSEFIQSFQVIIIFASDSKYIESYSGEICELFNVKYDNSIELNSNTTLWIHNQKGDNFPPKLLIHTRQLTSGAHSKLIDRLSDVVANFINKNNIEIIISN